MSDNPLEGVIEEFKHAKPPEKIFIVGATVAVGGIAAYLYFHNKGGATVNVNAPPQDNASGSGSSGGQSAGFPLVPSGSVPVLPSGIQPIMDANGNVIAYGPTSTPPATPPASSGSPPPSTPDVPALSSGNNPDTLPPSLQRDLDAQKKRGAPKIPPSLVQHPHGAKPAQAVKPIPKPKKSSVVAHAASKPVVHPAGYKKVTGPY